MFSHTPPESPLPLQFIARENQEADDRAEGGMPAGSAVEWTNRRPHLLDRQRRTVYEDEVDVILPQL